MVTLATLKQMVANRLGKTDNATANTLRDNAIIDACRQIYQDARFSWLMQKATLTVTAGVANLPTDFNVNFGLHAAFSPQTGVANDYPYVRVGILDIDAYSPGDATRTYYINYDATNKVFVFNSNQTSDSVTIFYYVVPADLTQDTDVTPIPDSTAIRDLAVSLWWLASERDETNADRFYQRYKERLAQMVSLDKVFTTERRVLRSRLDGDFSSGESILATQR